MRGIQSWQVAAKGEGVILLIDVTDVEKMTLKTTVWLSHPSHLSYDQDFLLGLHMPTHNSFVSFSIKSIGLARNRIDQSNERNTTLTWVVLFTSRYFTL